MDSKSQILAAVPGFEPKGGTDAVPEVAPSGEAATFVHAPGRRDGLPETGLLDDRYWLTGLLGEGSSAAVYRGTDLRLRRPVAVKIFHSPATGPAAAARQRTEMLALAQLNHSNLVSIYDARMMSISAGGGAADRAQHSYLVMELVDGVSLAQRLSGSAMTLDEAGAVGIAVASALAAVHHLGLVHRDVKPANILLPAAGGAKLTDFGIARLLNSPHLTITAEVVGTPLYLSPEQAAGAEVGPGTDIYSLGLVLLECVTGNPEFPGAPVQSAIARTLRDPRVPPNLPAPWPDLLRSMTSSVSDERPTADAVAATLTGYLQDRERSRTATTITAAPTPPGVRSLGNAAIPRRHQPLPGEWVAPAPSVPSLVRDLSIVSCAVALTVMTAVVALTAMGGVGGYPTGPTITDSATTRTVTARNTAATAIPAATYRADWNVMPTVTVITTETDTATPTTTTTATSESIMPSTSTSESILPSTSTSESPIPTPPSESTTPSTTPSESTTPSTTTSESSTDSTATTAPPRAEDSPGVHRAVGGRSPGTPGVG